MLQGDLAHKEMHTPLGPPLDPDHGPTVGSYGVAVSYEQGAPEVAPPPPPPQEVSVRG